MADFNLTVPIVLRDEGGYVNDPDDDGGETYKGISRKFHPDWPGWKLVDQDRTLPRFPGCLEQDVDLQADVREFYYQYWTPLPLAQVSSQDVANMIYDMSFPMGYKNVTDCVQKAIYNCGLMINIDGNFGPQTLRDTNTIHPGDIIPILGSVCKMHFRDRAVANPKDIKFLSGWLNRVNWHITNYQNKIKAQVGP